ncbi:hypothetical protein GQ42DRAFT_170017 [Ramicandelaber brevisporus]|nr:hypothetical protein GQ42DRAFT_170017 [Ramicandelaber brevisporus]
MSRLQSKQFGNLADYVERGLLAHRVPTKVGVQSPDDVVIVSALRTAITRGRRGGFKDTHPEELLSAVIKAILTSTKIDPSLIDDVVVGNVLPRGGGATVARMACLHAGLPERSSVMTVNRQCSSGLQAVVSIATAIQSGLIDIGLGCGVESMTQHNHHRAKPEDISDKIKALPAANDCLMPMGITSENVAKQFGITRERQDKLAALSHQKAEAAQKAGLFDSEIVPVTVTVLDAAGENPKEMTITRDDGVRPGTTAEKLGKLKPAFDADGFTTAGNASQVSDGAAGVLLMKRSTAQRLGLSVLGKFVSSAVVGVPPNVMGIGPAFVIPAACQKAGIKVDDVDIFELNEAFASQAVRLVE